VQTDPDYLELYPGTRSELDAPLRIGDRVVGVLGLESDRLAAFDEIDALALQALADLAAVVIQTARLYSELQQTCERLTQIKGFVGSKTAVDWIRMVSTAWGHSIKREVGTSLVCAELVRQAIRGGRYQEALQELSDLEQKVRDIKDIPITAPLSAEDAVSSVRINGLVKGYLRNLWRHAQYASIDLDLDLEPDLDSLATIRASEEWIRRGLEIVVDNAAQAMLEHKSTRRRLTARTRLNKAVVEILVRDTGPGIPERIKNKLFKEPIDKPRGSRGAGIGLLLASTIFETYQGTIDVFDSGPSGTQIAISLPIETNGS
jgi:signal transduction histidine kinase